MKGTAMVVSASKKGNDLKSAVAVLEAFLKDYKEGDHEDDHFTMLRYIVRKTSAQVLEVPENKIFFTNKELYTDALGLSSDDDSDKIRRKINACFDQAEKLLEKYRPKLEGMAREAQYPGYALLKKGDGNRSGGAKRRSTFFLTLQPVTEEQEYPLPHNGLRYRFEQDVKIGRHNRWLQRLTLNHHKFWIVLGVLVFYIAGGAFCFWLFMKYLLSGQLAALVTLTICAVLAHWLIGPFFRLIDRGIIIAPLLFQQLLHDGVLIILPVKGKNPFGGSLREIRLQFFCADCPVCGGYVLPRDGGRRYENRVIGQCQKNPQEHLFSFDHVTKTGAPLRDAKFYNVYPYSRTGRS